MTAIVATLGVVVLLLSVLVAGLLRSHATILRRLHELGAGIDPGAPVADRSAGPARAPRTDGTVPAPPADLPEGRPATDVVGVGPNGEAIAVRVTGVDHDTLLVFLSTGCSTCAGFWKDLAATQETAARVVVVTRDPAEESPSAVRELAPEGVTVVCSTAAWESLRVPGSPYVVHVHGPSGRVAGEGTAASWDQVRDLLLRATGDHELGVDKPTADRRRERQLDRLLLEAGVAPGDASLYGPSHDHAGGATATGRDASAPATEET